MDKRLGQILVAQGAVTEGTLARALGYQRSAPSQTFRLGSILFSWNLVEEEELLAAPRLDNLASVHAGLAALLSVEEDVTPVVACSDTM